MKLIMSMKDKGFDYATIGKAMDMMGVDNKINQAKSNMYQQQFINALGTGNYAGAGAALSNLAEINKPQAAMLASYFPSFKDNWNVDVARQNAAQAHKWNRADKKEDMALQNAYRQADLRQKIQLQEMQRQRAISSLVGIGMPQAEAEAYVDGRYRKPSSTGGSKTANTKAPNETYVDESGVVHYDKETDKKVQNFYDKLNGFIYDVSQIKGSDDTERRTSTGDALDELQKELELLRPYITYDDYDKFHRALYAGAAQRQVNSGYPVKFN